MTPLDICIDISDAQGPPNPPIDWKAVYTSGIRIAFIKALEGNGLSYPTWKSQSIGARAAGIMVVPYFFLRPVDPVAAVAHFKTVTGLVSGMPFALDWEGRASQTCTAQIAETIGLGLEKISGRTPVGYWGNPGSTPAQPTNIMQTWDRWIPRYPQVPQPSNFAALSATNKAKQPPGSLFWQYTSNGTIPGVKGSVDRSVWLGTGYQLNAWFATGARPQG
jgi:lysozyme